MDMYEQNEAAKKVAELYADVGRRCAASGCPVEMLAAFVRLCLAQSCGKCVPCRVGLDKIVGILDNILDGEAELTDLTMLGKLAKAIYDSADCAIGFEAAKLVLDGMNAFADDYRSHIEFGTCHEQMAKIPCSEGCPAHVDIPGYIACIGARRYADAVRVIRRDNPFPSVCGLVCEHPCENFCRRRLVDDAINIRGLKRYAVEHAGIVPPPMSTAKNGKRVGIVGGGPAGLTAAYFLSLKGFEVLVYERRGKLGGMLRFGIPSYRLPDADLDRDIEAILSTGVKAVCNSEVFDLDVLRKKFDAVYLSIGAHGAKKLRIEGEDAEGVLSAVDLLGAVGEGERPDFSGKKVVVIGGGNVAMDVTRTSKRLGAESVSCVYRRRIIDMTALPDEIAGAQSEGCEIVQLMAPVRIAVENGKVVGLVVKPQIAGPIKNGRPSPMNSVLPEMTIPADIIIVAIGQDIQSDSFGLATKHGAFVAKKSGEIMDGVFTGGDCYSGPATVIRAIDAGKTAAKNIGARFGIDMTYSDVMNLPSAPAESRLNWGRVNMRERDAESRKHDFNLMEKLMSEEEARLECSRCLRCDCRGRGAMNGGRR